MNIQDLKNELEELKEKVTELEESIEELEQEKEELQESLDDIKTELNESFTQDDFLEQKEELAQHAFESGYEANKGDDQLIKAWLNYKIEARI